MGITKLSLDRIERHNIQPCKLLILGCQNLYNAENYYEVAHGYFEDLGFNVRSWDILGCQGSEIVDLREDLGLMPEYDVILQHGTIEHCDGSLYQVFKNIHEACNTGGLMVHENPKTGNWPGHGYHYFTTGFYENISKGCNYDLLEIVEEPAMGNITDGWNVSAVMRKTSDNFITQKQFDSYGLLTK